MLSQALTSDPMHSQMLERVSTNEALKEKILQRSTSLQVLLLHCCSRGESFIKGVKFLFCTFNWALGKCFFSLISLQVSVLEDLNKPGRKVCVANTHLFYHPKGTAVLLCLQDFYQISVSAQLFMSMSEEIRHIF